MNTVNNSKAGPAEGKAGSRLVDVIVSMRPKQWIKNVFIFAGLIFSKSFFSMEAVLRTIYAFALFSAVSGTVYVINDVIDREKDILHPVKSKRPIASGRLKPGEALLPVLFLLVLAFLLSCLLDVKFFALLAGYFLLVLAYSLVLKNHVIIDVMAIAAGFVLRTLGGTVIIKVSISPWLIMCTTFLSLFLALNKRKSELDLLLDNASNHRENLGRYTPGLIDQMLPVVTSTTIMSYSLYTFSSGKSSYMMLTIPFVIYGIFRYQYIVTAKSKGGSPETDFLEDKPLLLNIVLWGISCLIIVSCFY
ncbi:MAG: decaprenyl-phosphate phosphoribosyltransferase [Clostridiaceae bacterium]|nr:decaprenyl-phosphate phosphoribosyltransferase [Clostridiaceae bacterium]